MGMFSSLIRSVGANIPTSTPEPLSKEDRMYAAETLDNFRWVSRLLSTYGSRPLTVNDRVPEGLSSYIAEIGQLAEVVYANVPMEFLIRNYSILSQPNYPLEGFNALVTKDCVLVDSYPVPNAEQRAHIFYRKSAAQLVVAIPGTASIWQAAHNLRVIATNHPSRRGAVHSGFWSTYAEMKASLIKGIQMGIAKHTPEELVLTGHSLGASLSYLLLIDLLASHELLLSKLKRLRIVVFGAPRTGSGELVEYYRELVVQSEGTHGKEFFKEYSVKGYNDGVHAVPPTALGYRHFCKCPLYTIGGRLYRVPTGDNEHSAFTLWDDKGILLFPKGGHNYYNGRDLELFRRRVGWLIQADVQRTGWEERYKTLAHERYQ